MTKEEALEQTYSVFKKLMKDGDVEVNIVLAFAYRERNIEWFTHQLDEFIEYFEELKRDLNNNNFKK